MGLSTRRGNVHFNEDIIRSSADAIKSGLLDSEDLTIEDVENTAEVLAF